MPGTAQISQEAIRAFEESAKIGLVATVDPRGLPHVSLITSIQARGPDRLMFGQFSEGLSKAHVRSNPQLGFLVMNRQRELWRGKARWTGEASSGEDYEMYNRKPMFRYNSYFGIHTVHYLDLVELSGKESISTAAVAAGSLVTALARRRAAARQPREILKPWAERHVSPTAIRRSFPSCRVRPPAARGWSSHRRCIARSWRRSRRVRRWPSSR
jgi:hypothetical protein